MRRRPGVWHCLKLALGLAGMVGCAGSSDSAGDCSVVADGTLVGRYEVTHHASTGQPVIQSGEVQVVIADGTYEFMAESYLLPPYGCGRVSQSGNTVTFDDTCPHTVEFDPTLIVDGEFTVTCGPGALELERRDVVNDRVQRFTLLRGWPGGR